MALSLRRDPKPQIEHGYTTAIRCGAFVGNSLEPIEDVLLDSVNADSVVGGALLLATRYAVSVVRRCGVSPSHCRCLAEALRRGLRWQAWPVGPAQVLCPLGPYLSGALEGSMLVKNTSHPEEALALALSAHGALEATFGESLFSLEILQA